MHPSIQFFIFKNSKILLAKQIPLNSPISIEIKIQENLSALKATIVACESSSLCFRSREFWSYHEVRTGLNFYKVFLLGRFCEQTKPHF